MQRVLGIYVKHPVPGQVKTRLANVFGTETASRLYPAFLRDLVRRFRETADRRFLCFTPPAPESAGWFADLAGSDYELWPQPQGSLEPRLQNFFAFAQEQGADTDRRHRLRQSHAAPRIRRTGSRAFARSAIASSDRPRMAVIICSDCKNRCRFFTPSNGAPRTSSAKPSPIWPNAGPAWNFCPRGTMWTPRKI